MSERSRRQDAVVSATAKAWAKVEEQKEVIEAFRQGINDLIDLHAPKFNRLEMLHPGWSGSLEVYCARCSRQWPCREINDLRALYGKATGWEPALRPYSPMTLDRPTQLAPTRKATA